MTSQSLRHVGDLLAERIACHCHLSRLTGSAKAGLLLSQAIYWTRVGEAIIDNRGWFHKTIAQWSHETGLSRREQESARRCLKALGLTEEELRGLPAKLWFRVNLERLGEALAGLQRISAPPLTLEALRTRGLEWVRQILGPILVFHRRLVQITGSVHAALVLSRHLEGSRRQARIRASHWMLPRQNVLQDETGLSRRELEHARAQLRTAGFIDDRLQGLPPVVAVRLDLDALALAAQRLGLVLRLGAGMPAGAREPSPGGDAVAHDSAFLDCGNPSIKSVVTPQSRMAFTAKSACAVTPNQDARKVQNSVADSGESSKQRTTKDFLTTTPPSIEVNKANAREADATHKGVGGWIYPQGLKPEERELCGVLLAGSRDPQKLLDELAGQMSNPVRRVPIANPLGYLRQLRQREALGVLVPEFAHRVRQAREAATATAARSGAAVAPEPRLPMPENVRAVLAAISRRRTA